MTDLLQDLQAAIDGDQLPANWKALLQVACSEIQYRKAVSATLQQLLEQAYDKLSVFNPPLFRIGETVTSWAIDGSDQNDVVYGKGNGRYSTGVVLKVNFYGEYYAYETNDNRCNTFEHLVQLYVQRP